VHGDDWKKGVQKEDVKQCKLIENHGLEGDAHAGSWHRQVGLVSKEARLVMENKGAKLDAGDFGENVLTEGIDFAKLIYPPMQVADIFIQGINFPHAGLDQRKAQVIARDCALQLKISPLLDKKGNKIKPVAIHGHLILGLQKPPIWPVPKENLQELWSQMKMSKSIPNSAIYMTDNEEEVKKKINNAFCPEGEIGFNPLLDWAKYIVFINSKSKLEINRPEKFGGNKTYNNYEELSSDFANKKLHPMDLKNAMANKINEILMPAREHFNQPQLKKAKEEMEKLIITR